MRGEKIAFYTKKEGTEAPSFRSTFIPKARNSYNYIERGR